MSFGLNYGLHEFRNVTCDNRHRYIRIIYFRNRKLHSWLRARRFYRRVLSGIFLKSVYVYRVFENESGGRIPSFLATMPKLLGHKKKDLP